MTRKRSDHNAAHESVRYWKPQALDGLECMRARYYTQNFTRHFHDGYAVGIIEQGAMAFDYLGQSHVASQGLVNLVVPGEMHDGHAAGPDGWTYRMFYLAPELVARAVREISGNPGPLPHFRAGVLSDPLLARNIHHLHRCMQPVQTGPVSLMRPLGPVSPAGRPAIGSLEQETRLLGLLALWIRRYCENPPTLLRPGAEPVAVRRAKEYMAAHLAEDMSLTRLARACHLSPFHLARVFHRSVGAPPHAYLTHLRLNRAKTLLGLPETTSYLPSLAEIAAETGFADQSHLTRRFKAVFGLTPGQYRKNIQYP
ncbi:MAG: AraC family ligand binding domain-containing protein [Desulfovibrio sp.]|uniref:helix-turn-helix domain-containing protein n=1 Tax=Desulfovibrio sp. 7SRBS1 TaxID=3378064 RepID=UPI003B3FFF25